MSVIQWYPGHMSKAVREMEENVKKVDVVAYVLDARAVSACFNPSFSRIAGGKPVLYVINKSDTVEASDLKLWIDYFQKKGDSVIATDSTNGRQANAVITKLTELAAAKLASYKAKGVTMNVRAMVIGVPNGGKSTLINSLCGGKKTVTGDRPGVTRGKQWVTVAKGIDLLDTPGTLWPSFDNQEYAKHLVFIGSIKDDVVDIPDMALELINFLSNNYPTLLISRYKIDSAQGTPIELFDKIAKARGYMLRGGEPDYDRTAASLLDDFRKRRMGKIMLEKPKD